ncbi:MAG: hypothetical protein ABI596_10910 [Pyrinomonadaceae bacterium]
MIMRKNLILPVALVAALIGGSVGAFVVSRQGSSSTDANVVRTMPATYSDVANTPNMQLASANSVDQLAANGALRFQTAQEQSAYREGFADGFLSAREATNGAVRTAATTAYAPTRSAARNVQYRSQARSSNNSRRVYYDYGNTTQPRSRTFWQKHRDKLTVGMGTGAGAIVGGLIGGKKGAGIGALAGAGGSALYTYKIRNKTRRY